MARGVTQELDRPLLLVVLAVGILGIYNLASAARPTGADLHLTQGVYFLVGLVGMFGIASFHYRHLEGLAIPIFVAALTLLLATDLFGKVVNGSRRWLPLGPVAVQTSDLAKFAVIVMMARTLHLERWENNLTLREIFRPFNLSRPLLILCSVILLSILGDSLKPPKVEERLMNARYRPLARLSEKQPILLVGRGKDAEVRLQITGVERRHAEIVRIADAEYLVRDLSAEEGVFINGARIQGSAPLHHGDTIRFGLNQRAELRFSATTQRWKPALPWLALFGVVYLAFAGLRQLRQGAVSARDLVAPIDIVLVPFALILAQPDLGTAMMVLLVAFSMILFVGLRPLSLVLLFSSAAIFSVVAWFAILKPYQKQRVLSFLDPTSDLAGSGYHQHQSLIAVGGGRISGKGWGQGTQTQLSFLPEQQTDFIFSVWGEEHGFVGTSVVVVLFAALILLSLRIAATARDRFGALLAMGATAMFFWHAAINMLMVLRLAPVVGVPLPLWSNGGSFMITAMMTLGLVFNVGKRRSLF